MAKFQKDSKNNKGRSQSNLNRIHIHTHEEPLIINTLGSMSLPDIHKSNSLDSSLPKKERIQSLIKGGREKQQLWNQQILKEASEIY